MLTPPEDRRPALRPPQFGLATLLWGVAILCVLLTALTLVGPLGAFALTMLILSVLAHVSGNALGMRLRDCGDQPVDEHDRPLARVPHYDRGVNMPLTPPRLSQHRRLGLVLTAIVALAMSLGAGGGAWWTIESQNPPPTAQDIFLAAAAFGVLGGIWGLIAGGFVVVGVSAVKEALDGARSSKPLP